MNAALRWNLISVEDYLTSELTSPTKHEYVGGVVYAMAGARFKHNVIAANVLAALAGRLRGKGCRALGSDMKIRMKLRNRFRFYYPEVSVVCRSHPDDAMFVSDPTSVFEVLSKGTRRTDEGEKKDGYFAIPSLKHYVLIEQDEPFVVVFRKKGRKFVSEIYEGLDAIVPLPEIGVELPLMEIYEGVKFAPEPPEDDQF